MKQVKPNQRTVARYNADALNLERNQNLPGSRQPRSRDTSKQGATWKTGNESPLATILEQKPGFRILIVDDNKPIRQLIRSILLSFGVENIAEATDGRTAIRKLQETLPDLVITDLEMSPMNGLEFTHQVRNNPRSPEPDLPIILMTGHTEKRQIMEIRKAGLTEIIAKPVTPSFISRNILAAMGRFHQKKARQAAKLASHESADSEDFFSI